MIPLTPDENKTQIAKSGALVPLTRLAKSKDMRVQRNATGALLNMTHSDENRQQLVNAGAIPVLVSLLNSPDTDVQYYCTTALSNIAVDGGFEVCGTDVRKQPEETSNDRAQTRTKSGCLDGQPKSQGAMSGGACSAKLGQ